MSSAGPLPILFHKHPEYAIIKKALASDNSFLLEPELLETIFKMYCYFVPHFSKVFPPIFFKFLENNRLLDECRNWIKNNSPNSKYNTEENSAFIKLQLAFEGYILEYAHRDVKALEPQIWAKLINFLANANIELDRAAILILTKRFIELNETNIFESIILVNIRKIWLNGKFDRFSLANGLFDEHFITYIGKLIKGSGITHLQINNSLESCKILFQDHQLSQLQELSINLENYGVQNIKEFTANLRETCIATLKIDGVLLDKEWAALSEGLIGSKVNKFIILDKEFSLFSANAIHFFINRTLIEEILLANRCPQTFNAIKKLLTPLVPDDGKWAPDENYTYQENTKPNFYNNELPESKTSGILQLAGSLLGMAISTLLQPKTVEGISLVDILTKCQQFGLSQPYYNPKNIPLYIFCKLSQKVYFRQNLSSLNEISLNEIHLFLAHAHQQSEIDRAIYMAHTLKWCVAQKVELSVEMFRTILFPAMNECFIRFQQPIPFALFEAFRILLQANKITRITIEPINSSRIFEDCLGNIIASECPWWNEISLHKPINKILLLNYANLLQGFDLHQLDIRHLHDYDTLMAFSNVIRKPSFSELTINLTGVTPDVLIQFCSTLLVNKLIIKGNQYSPAQWQAIFGGLERSNLTHLTLEYSISEETAHSVVTSIKKSTIMAIDVIKRSDYRKGELIIKDAAQNKLEKPPSQSQPANLNQSYSALSSASCGSSSSHLHSTVTHQYQAFAERTSKPVLEDIVIVNSTEITQLSCHQSALR